jgi:hypothetical protein
MHGYPAEMQEISFYLNLALVLAAARRVLGLSWSECMTRIYPCLCRLRSPGKKEIHGAYRAVLINHQIYLQS